ncbi:MAG: UbiA family prenyltransferase [Bacteroidota bacterium]
MFADTLRYSNVVIAGVAVAFTSGTYALLGLPVSVPVLVLAGCATFTVYQLDRQLGYSSEDQLNASERLDWMRRHRWWSGVGGVGALAGMGWSMVHLQPRTLLLCILLAVIAISQLFPVLPGGRRLKDLGWTKPIVLAGTWAAGAVLVPVVEAGMALSLTVWLFLGYRFAFAFPNALIADWPDRAGDRSAGLSTWALQLGERRLVWISRSVLTVALVGALVAGVSDARWWLDAGGYLLMLLLIRRPIPESRWYVFTLDLLLAWPVVLW